MKDTATLVLPNSMFSVKSATTTNVLNARDQVTKLNTLEPMVHATTVMATSVLDVLHVINPCVLHALEPLKKLLSLIIMVSVEVARACNIHAKLAI